MIDRILSLLMTIESGATVSLLSGESDERVGAALRSAKRTLNEAQVFIDLLASIVGVELPVE